MTQVTPQPPQPPQPPHAHVPAAPDPAANISAPPGDTDLGWRLGALLLLVTATLQAAGAISRMASDAMIQEAGGRRAPSAESAAQIQMMISVIGVALQLTAAAGLYRRQVWGKWLALGLIIFGGVALIGMAVLLNNRDLPTGSPVAVVIAAIWLMAGWYVLLDRPTNRNKVVVGFVMTVLFYVATVLYAVATAEPRA